MQFEVLIHQLADGVRGSPHQVLLIMVHFLK
jgi:hypothetical protein